MADVTDTHAIRFVKEQVRPLCEDARALMARATAMQTDWFAGINATIGTGTGHVLEARPAAEGVPDLTQDQATNAVANLLAMLAASNSQILATPCVRPLAAE